MPTTTLPARPVLRPNPWYIETATIALSSCVQRMHFCTCRLTLTIPKCVSTTALGLDVVPDVKIMHAGDSAGRSSRIAPASLRGSVFFSSSVKLSGVIHTPDSRSSMCRKCRTPAALARISGIMASKTFSLKPAS